MRVKKIQPNNDAPRKQKLIQGNYKVGKIWTFHTSYRWFNFTRGDGIRDGTKKKVAQDALKMWVSHQNAQNVGRNLWGRNMND